MDFSRITNDLFIGTTPSTKDYEVLRRHDVKLVINMRVERRPHRDRFDSPISFLWLPSFDSPLVPISLKFLRRGVESALGTIRDGGKVYAHCAGGVHRGVTMGACILIAQGHESTDAMNLIKKRRRVADPFVFYIRSRILKFEKEWKT